MQKWPQSNDKQKCSLTQNCEYEFARPGAIFNVIFSQSHLLKSVFFFGDMHDWNVPVNISILLSVANSWSFNGNALKTVFEQRHDQINKVTVRPAQTQISLGIRPVWSESSLCAQWVAKDPSFLHVDSEDPDQTGRMLGFRWAHSHFVGFVISRLILHYYFSKATVIVDVLK